MPSNNSASPWRILHALSVLGTLIAATTVNASDALLKAIAAPDRNPAAVPGDPTGNDNERAYAKFPAALTAKFAALREKFGNISLTNLGKHRLDFLPCANRIRHIRHSTQFARRSLEKAATEAPPTADCAD
jgi:hypothetical protein